MLELVGNLKTSLGEHIQNLAWMSDATKSKAMEKLSAFTVKVGYPDTWKDYSGIIIDPKKSYWENVKSASIFHVKDSNEKCGKPVDKAEWGMTPQTVNAYYNRRPMKSASLQVSFKLRSSLLTLSTATIMAQSAL